MRNTPEQIQAWNNELDTAESAARELKQWLTDNPHASIEAIRVQRSKLMDELQKINDLVTKIKGPLPYTVK